MNWTRSVLGSGLALLLSGCGALDVVNSLSSGAGVQVRHDLAYGDGARQRYDLYTPAGAASDAPLVIFFYGGGWSDGAKEDYAFVANTLARQGYLVALPDYRVHPEVRFPAFMEDAAKAVAQIRRDAADGRPVFLSGHSAGAHIGALLLADPRYLAAEGVETCSAAKGFAGVAGPYDFDIRREPYLTIFPENLRPQEQPVRHADGAFPPAILFHGTTDTTVKPEEAESFASALRAAGNSAEARYFDDVDHYTILGAFVVPYRWRIPLVDGIVAFIEGEKAKGYPGCTG